MHSTPTPRECVPTGTETRQDLILAHDRESQDHTIAVLDADPVRGEVARKELLPEPRG